MPTLASRTIASRQFENKSERQQKRYDEIEILLDGEHRLKFLRTETYEKFNSGRQHEEKRKGDARYE